MKKETKRAQKMWIGFGILTIICGIGLILSNQYLIGTSGSIVGFWLILQNVQQFKHRDEEE
ncbi:MAG: hypothetical protein AB8G15_19660 [Saprospiraceae bacterium]